MIDVNMDEIAKKLCDLMQLMTRKLLRPIEQLTKNFTSPLQLHTMLILSEKKFSTMTEISRDINISKQQMTPIIDRLIDTGFVHREHDNIDRRSVNINLTSAGVDFLDNFGKNITSVMKRKIECLDNDDLHSLHHALDDLSRIIHKIS